MSTKIPFEQSFQSLRTVMADIKTVVLTFMEHVEQALVVPQVNRAARLLEVIDEADNLYLRVIGSMGSINDLSSRLNADRNTSEITEHISEMSSEVNGYIQDVNDMMTTIVTLRRDKLCGSFQQLHVDDVNQLIENVRQHWESADAIAAQWKTLIDHPPSELTMSWQTADAPERITAKIREVLTKITASYGKLDIIYGVAELHSSQFEKIKASMLKATARFIDTERVMAEFTRASSYISIMVTRIVSARKLLDSMYSVMIKKLKERTEPPSQQPQPSSSTTTTTPPPAPLTILPPEAPKPPHITKNTLAFAPGQMVAARLELDKYRDQIGKQISWTFIFPNQKLTDEQRQKITEKVSAEKGAVKIFPVDMRVPYLNNFSDGSDYIEITVNVLTTEIYNLLNEIANSYN